jgi:hypothetical protein
MLGVTDLDQSVVHATLLEPYKLFIGQVGETTPV